MGANVNCLICGGTLTDSLGKPCPNCSKDIVSIPICSFVPAQYQGVKFDKSFLPTKMQTAYGEFMESLLEDIISNYATYQKNWLICSRPNSGKTVWSYNLISRLSAKGASIPPLRDIIEVRNILNSYKTDDEENELFNQARVAIIRLPADMQPWMFDTVAYVLERRVRNNGFTIFFYGGSEEDLKNADRGNKMRYLKGSGSYNSVYMKGFY